MIFKDVYSESITAYSKDFSKISCHENVCHLNYITDTEVKIILG
jgi:hypothetical protein